MRENSYQSYLKKRLLEQFPGSIVLKNDPNYLQGIPDLIVLYKKKWACLEVKVAENASHQPNQDYYVGLMNKMSFAAFIYPDNEEDVFDELQRTLQPSRKARLPRS